MSSHQFAKIVGIDLGTTKSVVAVVADGEPMVIPNKEGCPITPSVVAYSENGDCLVGDIAKRKSIVNYQNTFYAAKRLIGRKFKDLIHTSASYYIEEDNWGWVKLNAPQINQQFTPEDISSQILRKLIDDASEYIGERINQAVITVPAYFNLFQRRSTIEAAKKAGLEVVRIINEPTAASLAYGLGLEEQTILVFDMGGGSLDVSILEIGDGLFKVLATSGDTQLGGNDFDQKIIDYIAEQVRESLGIDFRQNKQALRYVMEVVEKSKIELSGSLQTEIDLSLLPRITNRLKNLENIILTRTKFEELCSDLILRCQIPIENAIRDAKVQKSSIDEVILVGGSTRIPAIQKLIQQLLSKKLRQTVNPDRVVALGAAIQAGIIAGELKETLLLDVTPMSLGIETAGGAMTKIILRNTTIPVDKSETVSTSEDNQAGILIHVVQGESDLVSDNISLGYLVLESIPPAPRSVPQIEIKLSINTNGIILVTVKDKGTGKEKSSSIFNNYTDMQQGVVPPKYPLPRKYPLPDSGIGVVEKIENTPSSPPRNLRSGSSSNFMPSREELRYPTPEDLIVDDGESLEAKRDRKLNVHSILFLLILFSVLMFILSSLF